MSQENHYVYRRRPGKPKTPEKASYDSDEEDYEEQPSGLFLQLKDRLVQTRNKKVIKHSTHNHPLLSYNILKEDQVFCTICEIDIIGRAYGCDQCCEFFIHKSCLHTPVKIQHWSHSDHPLTLVTSTEDVSFVLCNCCQDIFKGGYHYHCSSTCKFNLHVACAGLPRSVQSNHHSYPLTLYSNRPIEDKETTNCNVCNDLVVLGGWIYYNADSEFVAHLDCGFTEEIEKSALGIRDRLQLLEVAT